MNTRHAVIKQVEGITFAAKADSGHWVMMDGGKDFGGSDAGATPKELLLLSLGGCTGSDVVSILKKKRSPVHGFELHVKGTLSEEHPKVFTDIHVEYVFYGDGIKIPDVERAIELSITKYCSVSAMLRKAVNLTHSYKIEPSEAVGARQPVMST
ncbi:MAG TPA: OsmC family protein [Bacteroidota bacterium]|jgi:putative redox protein